MPFPLIRGNPEQAGDPFGTGVDPSSTNLPDPSTELSTSGGAGNGAGFDWSSIFGGGSPTSTTTTPTTSGIPDWLKNLIPGAGNDPASALLLPSWAAAYKQWQDAAKYKETAKDAAKYGDPFGQANRSKYQQMLDDSYSHPENVLNDPGHQATIQTGLNTVSRADASKGYLGSGNMEADLAKFVANENAKYLDTYRKGLEPLTGSQFNPAAAGDFLMRGNEQAINSQNSALSSMFLPFLMKSTNNSINNNNPTTNNTKPGGTNNNPSTDPDLVKAVTAGDKDAINKAIDAGIRFVKLPDGSTGDLWAMARGGYRTGEPDFMNIHSGGNPYPGYTNVPSDPPPGEVPVGPPDLTGPPSPPPPDFPEPDIPSPELDFSNYLDHMMNF